MAKGTLGTPFWGIILAGLAATGCTTTSKTSEITTKSIRPAKVTYNYTAKDRDCLKRAMYFESDRSDPSGYMAVGTVVMNRLTSGAYPDTICGIVAQEKQFAPGVMTREVKPAAEPALNEAADAILQGKRHPSVKDAMFFHTQGLSFPYNNMHYVAVAGGNAFYEKRDPENGLLETPPPLPAVEVAMNYVPPGGVSPMSFDAQRFAQPAVASNAPFQVGQTAQPNADALPGVAGSNSAAAAFVSQPGLSAPARPTQTAYELPLPNFVPVPTPMPGIAPDAGAPATSASPTNIVLPTPRPSFTSAAMGSRVGQIGG